MKAMSVLFARWKGAKITTKHAMHVPRAYRVSLASLRPNQVPCLTKHATHIAKWVTHAIIVDAPPFHGEMSYNDEYMVWFHPRTIRHIIKETLYWDTLIGQLTLDDARDACNISEPAIGRGRQVGGRQGYGGHQSSQHPKSS
ncbi:hypothetical protein CFP56_010866 [Quercus suber]|uniref:Uncharacterized protein n=1 Tax=Quercus suber TaxID=58331 RepID=A0AAW0KYE2_QUESU